MRAALPFMGKTKPVITENEYKAEGKLVRERGIRYTLIHGGDHMQRQQVSEILIEEKLLDMMKTTPFQKIKVTEFVEFAGISRSSFYVYFDSIYSVIQKMEDDFISGLTDEDEMSVPISEGDYTGGFDPKTIAKVEYIRNNLRMIQILTGENGDPLFQARMANRTWRIFRKRYANRSKLPESQQKLICEYMCGGQLNLYRWYANHAEETTIYEMGILLEKLTSRVLSLL